MTYVECCATCEQPKSRTNVPGQERERGWPVCINPDCIAFGEGVASACYRDVQAPDEGVVEQQLPDGRWVPAIPAKPSWDWMPNWLRRLLGVPVTVNGVRRRVRDSEDR